MTFASINSTRIRLPFCPTAVFLSMPRFQAAWQQKIRQKNVQIDTLRRDLQVASDKVLALQIQVPPTLPTAADTAHISAVAVKPL